MTHNYLLLRKSTLSGLKINFFILVFILSIQLKNNCFAQEGTAAITGNKFDSIPTTTDSTSVAVKDNFSGNYSLAGFPGGNNEFIKYLIHNVRMPRYNQKTEAKIIVIFTIEESGKLANFQASGGPDEFKKEAIRVIKKSGKWFPAYKDGKPVASERQQKISFFME